SGVEGQRPGGAAIARRAGELPASSAFERRILFCGLRKAMRSKYSSFDPTRRQMIRSMVAGSALLPAVLQQCLADSADDLAPKAPHFPPQARRVIFINCSGGVSHVETFDPKPALVAAAREHKKARNGKPYLGPLWEFKRESKCGAEVSDLFPWIRKSMDDICLIRSMYGDHKDHAQAPLGVH